MLNYNNDDIIIQLSKLQSLVLYNKTMIIWNPSFEGHDRTNSK